jgi:uncharacterized protein YggE
MNQSILENTFFGRAAIAVLVLLAVFLAAASLRAFEEYRFVGAGVGATNTITVNGESERFVAPDLATVMFTVSKEGNTASAAQEAATQITNRALAYLEGEGIEEKDIQTSSYSVYPKYEYPNRICLPEYCPPQGNPEIVGYEASQTVTVKVRDIDAAGTVLAGLGDTGVTNLSGPNFTVEDEEDIRREVRKEAIADAKEQARELARDLGVRLVRIVSFSDGGYYQPYYSREAYGMGGADAAMATNAPAPELPAGENRIFSQVSITYEIR